MYICRKKYTLTTERCRHTTHRQTRSHISTHPNTRKFEYCTLVSFKHDIQEHYLLLNTSRLLVFLLFLFYLRLIREGEGLVSCTAGPVRQLDSRYSLLLVTSFNIVSLYLV